MLANLRDCFCFGDEIVVLHIDSCASIVGFRDVVGKTVKVAKYDGLVRIVKAAALALRCSCDYDLSQFTFVLHC